MSRRPALEKKISDGLDRLLRMDDLTPTQLTQALTVAVKWAAVKARIDDSGFGGALTGGDDG